MMKNMSKQETLLKTLADHGVMISRLYLSERLIGKHPVCRGKRGVL